MENFQNTLGAVSIRWTFVAVCYMVVLLFPAKIHAQWSGAASSTDYASIIHRDGNIEVNRLTFGRYGSAILDDTNPFSIFSRHDAGTHDLLLFGNSQAVLHLRLYDGDLKIGNATVPNATLFNNGSAYFLNNVGIGTSNPVSKLHIRGGHIVIDMENAGDPVIFTGTGATEYNRYLRLSNSPNLSTGSGLKSSGILVADSYAYANPGKNDLVVKGNISVGTAAAGGYRLAVAGKAVAEEIVVKPQVNWPDYVFAEGHDVPSLGVLEQFISDNKHLPEVPTAEEVKHSGISVGEMNAILLKKVEELTLYVIDINKRVKALEDANDRLEQENSELRNNK